MNTQWVSAVYLALSTCFGHGIKCKVTGHRHEGKWVYTVSAIGH